MSAHAPESRAEPVAALVLGAAVWEGGVASPTLRRRAEHAARLYADGTVSHVIACGGVGRFAPSEAELIERICREGGVPAEVILLDDRSTRTLENITNALPLLEEIGVRRVAIVTDRYHQPRARLIARRAGLSCIDVPSVPPGAMTAKRMKAWLREIPAYLWYLLRPGGMS